MEKKDTDINAIAELIHISESRLVEIVFKEKNYKLFLTKLAASINAEELAKLCQMYQNAISGSEEKVDILNKRNENCLEELRTVTTIKQVIEIFRKTPTNSESEIATLSKLYELITDVLECYKP